MNTLFQLRSSGFLTVCMCLVASLCITLQCHGAMKKADSAALWFINNPGSSLAKCTLLLPILIMCTLLFMLIDCHHSCWKALSRFLIIFPVCEDHFEVLILYLSLYISDGVILRFYKHNHFTQMLNNTRVRICSLAISLDGAGICYLTVIPKAC